jgi:O-antigen/teichoic acid export membrane protein
VQSSRFRRLTALLISFLAGQGSVQVLNLISGFFLLRWLSVEAYAQYSVAFGFQSTLNMLIDLGFSGSIIALVGDRAGDKAVVGNYIRSAKHFRNRLFAIIIPGAAIAFPLVTSQQHWDWITQLLLYVSIVPSIFFQGWVSYYSVPLLINRQLNRFYQPQIISAVGRIVSCFSLYFVSALNSWTTAWVSSAVIALNGILYRRATTTLIAEPTQSDPKLNREMVRYLSPLIPVLIFTAFQGQISLALITIFGHTKSIAEVAALGRLGQLFFILGAFNGVVVVPYLAKVAPQNLAKKYFQILVFTVTLAVILSLIGFLFPDPLLWILGTKYQSLRAEVGWVVTTASVNYVSSTLYSLNSSRKWIYWWGSAFEITLIVIVQIICLSVMELSTTLQVVYFSLIVAVGYAILHSVIGSYGLVQNHRLCLELEK